MLATRVIRAPRGTALACKGWRQEAALRMLHNSLDPEVAPTPDAACAEAFDTLAGHLQQLENDQTLVVQPGKPAGVFPTHPLAPRVLICGPGWMSIGDQDVLHTAYEAFAAAALRHFGGSLAGKLVVSDGVGIQPLAATMNGASFLGIEADPEAIKRRVRTGYCDILVNSLDEAIRILRSALHKNEAVSVGLAADCADVLPEMVRRGIVPDLLTVRTGAALDLQAMGSIVCDPVRAARPGLLRWVALSGEAADIAALDELVLQLFPQNEGLARWIRLARKRVKFQGLPARLARLGSGDRTRFAVAVNEMVARGELRAPIVIASDHTGANQLRPLLDTAAGASWVWVDPAGLAGQASVADGAAATAGQLERVLSFDPCNGGS